MECRIIPVNAINVPHRVKSAARVVGAKLLPPPPMYWVKKIIPEINPNIIMKIPGIVK